MMDQYISAARLPEYTYINGKHLTHSNPPHSFLTKGDAEVEVILTTGYKTQCELSVYVAPWPITIRVHYQL